MKAKVPDTTVNFDDSDSDSDETSDEEQEESTASTTGFAPKESIMKDFHLYDETRYEKLYTWLYFSQAFHGYMCKTCEDFYGKNTMPSGKRRGGWSHKGAVFKDNPGKKLRGHANTKPHRDAIESQTHLRIKDTLSCSEDSHRKKKSTNELYLTKLIRIVHFLARHNLAIKELYKLLVNFIAFELEEPVTKQYLENCAKHAIYGSHGTCDSLTDSINEYLKKETDEKLCNAPDIVIYSDETTSAAQKEMMSLFLGCFDEIEKEFMLEYLSLVEVSLTKSGLLLDKVTAVLKGQNTDIKDMWFCFEGTNSMSEETPGLQRRLRNATPHSMYVNC